MHPSDATHSFYFIQVGDTALHLAAKSEMEGKEKINVLLKHGADTNMQNIVSAF